MKNLTRLDFFAGCALQGVCASASNPDIDWCIKQAEELDEKLPKPAFVIDAVADTIATMRRLVTDAVARETELRAAMREIKTLIDKHSAILVGDEREILKIAARFFEG